MNILLFVYNEILFRPLLNGLIFLTNVLPLHDLGLAVIVLTIAVRVALFPFTHRSIKTQVSMKKIEPELRKIREKFKDDQQEQAKQMMELYKKHGISPFSGCLMLLIQLPILIALYRVLAVGIIDIHLENLYSFVAAPEFIQMKFLGLVDMSKTSAAFAFLAATTQFFQIKLAKPLAGRGGEKSFGAELSQMMAKQSLFIFPVFIFFITMRFPSAVALYWTTMNVFAIVHEGIIRKKAKKIKDDGREKTKYSTNDKDPA